MVNLSMPHRSLSSIVLLLAMAVGCTERPSNDPAKPADQVLAQEKEAGGSDGQNNHGQSSDGSPAGDAAGTGKAPNVEVETSEDGVTIKGKEPVFRGGYRRMEKDVDPAVAAKELSRIGSITLELSDLPPTADPIESGRYLLSIVIQLTSGSFNKDQWPCHVDVDGPKVMILLENRQTDPILATLEDGLFLSEPAEGPAMYGLEGKVVGPGKLRGVVIPGPEDHPSVGIVEGRWGLDALPAEKESDK